MNELSATAPILGTHTQTQCIFRLVISVRIEPTVGLAKPLRANMRWSGCHWNVSGVLVLLVLLMYLSPAFVPHSGCVFSL